MSDLRLRLALKLARRGGRLAVASRGRAHASWKGPGDRVTEVAAGAAMLLEAGGVVTDPGGRAILPASASAYGGDPMPILAGNRGAHEQALARLPRSGRRDESGGVSARSQR